MQIPRPSEADKQLFASLVSDLPGVTVKPMFGNLGAFVNGNMFAGLFGSTIGVRLLEAASREELDRVEGVSPFGPAERPMRDYVGLPANLDTVLASEWMLRARDQVAQLPPKAPKGR